MRAVVTGGAGFVGSHLIDKLLAHGNKVVCIERPGSSRGWLKGLDVEFHACGLTDVDVLRQLVSHSQVVYHLAALTEARSPEECYAVNTEGTANVVRAAATCRGTNPRLVFMSSLAAVGPVRSGVSLTGDSIPLPLSHYGRSKLQAEAVIHAFADRVPAVICRFPAVYGPRDRVVLKLFQMVGHGFALTVGPWDRQVSIVHAFDAVDGLIAAGQSPDAPGRTYYLAHPTAITWGEFVATIGRALGRRVRCMALPVAAARQIAVAAEILAWLRHSAAVLNRDRVRELAQASWVCDPSAAMTEIGFMPRYCLDRGVMETADWLRRNQWI